MRRSNKTNTLVLVSDPTKALYEDRWEGDILFYTGMGTKGDQKLDFMQNKTLFESNTNSVVVHLFEVFKKGEYYYHGLVSLVDEPYFERQLDADKKFRNVVIFPLKLIDGYSENSINKDLLDESEEIKKKSVQKLSDFEVRDRVSEYNVKPGQRRVFSINYQRNRLVSENAKREAKGICQLCGYPAPFNNIDGTPFLEVHHIIWLSRGGFDSVKNTVALCPNCHRKMHVLDLEEDIKKLQTIKY
jgi:5-methylcytosine-specific restriction enzyme A